MCSHSSLHMAVQHDFGFIHSLCVQPESAKHVCQSVPVNRECVLQEGMYIIFKTRAESDVGAWNIVITWAQNHSVNGRVHTPKGQHFLFQKHTLGKKLMKNESHVLVKHVSHHTYSHSADVQ